MKHSFIEKIYCLSVVLAFGLLFYSNAEAQEAPDGTIYQLGLGKAFYIPCGIALVSSFFLKIKRDWLDRMLYCLIFVAILSSLIHPPLSGTFLTWTVTRFVMAILCFKGVRDIDPLLLAKYATVLSPLIVFPHYILSDPFSYGVYRYGGFYGDPNFLALALNIIIALCCISFRNEDSKLIKILSACSIAGSVPIILLGMSRGGIIGLAIVILSLLLNTFKKNKFGFSVLLLLVLISGFFISRKMGSTLNLIEDRYMLESESDRIGSKARVEGVKSAFHVFEKKPGLLLFGIGLGNTYDTINLHRDDGYSSVYVIHNTFISLLFELGLVGLILYLLIYYQAFREQFRRRNYFMVGILLSVTVSLLTLPGAAFMPGWIFLFFAVNKQPFSV